MGRAISYPTGAQVCFTVIACETDDDWAFEFEWFKEDCVERAREAFPSLYPFDGWRGREDHILLRNAFADFGLSTLGDMVAIWIAVRDDGRFWDDDADQAVSHRAGHWLRQIAPRFDAMFGDYDCLRHMSNGEGVYRKRNPPNHVAVA
jgi:hypothetical protein